MSNNGAHSSLPTPNSSASSSTGDTPFVSNATLAASSSTSTPQGPPPPYETLTLGTPAEQEVASRPRRDQGQQRARLRALRVLQQVLVQRAQSQLRATGAQPPLPLQHGPQPVINPPPQPPHHQQAHPPNVPAVPNPNVPGPSRNALNGTANGNAGVGAGYGPPGVPNPMQNAGFPPPPSIPYVPQGPMYLWPAYGHHVPAPHYYAGYPGPHAQGVAPVAAPHHGPPTHAPPAPAVQALPNAAPPPSATQGHMPQPPEGVNHGAPSFDQGVRQAPPVHWPPPVPFAGPPYHQQQFQQAQIPQLPPLGPVEGVSTRALKRKAVDDNDTTRQKQKQKQKQKRHYPQDDPNFVLVQSDPDGRQRWKCLKTACANVKPMLENSVHKHVTATNSHQADSSESPSEYTCPGCGTTFKRLDSMTRHEPSNQCVRNKSKSPQINSLVLGNSSFTATPSSPGPAPSSVTQQSLPLPVGTPDIVQAVGNSTFVAAAPVVLPQRQSTFQSRGPAPSSVAQQSGVQAIRTEPRSVTPPGPSLPVLAQENPSLPEVQSDIQASLEPTSVQRQPAVALPLQAIQGDVSTPDQTSSAPEPRSVQPPSGNSVPVIAGDFTLSIFNQTATSLPPILPSSSLSPSEDVVNDSSADLFSDPRSPTPSEDAPDSSHLFSDPPSPAPSDVPDFLAPVLRASSPAG